jgi:hypothetical protein
MEDTESEIDLREIDDKSGRPIHPVEGVTDKHLAGAASQTGDNMENHPNLPQTSR